MKYRVVFLGLISSEKDFKERMFRLGASSSILDRMIRKAPVILKGNMPLGEARRYADAVQGAGGRVNIQEHGIVEDTMRPNRAIGIRPLKDFIMCPECGYKQLKTEACEKCGLVFEKGPYQGDDRRR